MRIKISRREGVGEKTLKARLRVKVKAKILREKATIIQDYSRLMTTEASRCTFQSCSTGGHEIKSVKSLPSLVLSSDHNASSILVFVPSLCCGMVCTHPPFHRDPFVLAQPRKLKRLFRAFHDTESAFARSHQRTSAGPYPSKNARGDLLRCFGTKQGMASAR